MSQSMIADGGRTETKRFEDDVSGDELIKGDRIDPALVARTEGQLGEHIARNGPQTRLVTATALNGMDDTHSALLIDPETGTIVRAGCHDSSSAWSQEERDWTVYETGTSVVVNDLHELEVANNDTPVADEHQWVQEWVDILFDDMRHGHFDYSDERELGGSTLKLRDVDGRQALASISLEA